ncbi:MAG: VOC family protein [Candidatus Binataceae bacterium]|nr:VOC family protein [Candidatus Binataceae bacterium]
MMGITQLGYVGVGVSKPEAWLRFASEILGLQPNGTDHDGGTFLRMDEHHYRLIVQEDSRDDIAFIGWETADKNGLEQIAQRLKSAGVEVTRGTRQEARNRHVAELVKFTDCDGLRSELYYGPLVHMDSPFRSPQARAGFVSGDQGLGHVVLCVNDFDRSLQFYRDVLLLRVTDFADFKIDPEHELELSVAFMHCNSRHHSLAFGAIPGFPKRLVHIMLQATSFDDVGSAYYLCQDREVPISMTLGRHTNDQMISFYVQTPAGFDIEFGWGARTVNDATWEVQRHDKASIWGHRLRAGILPGPGKAA